jgi:hypothetical protein
MRDRSKLSGPSRIVALLLAMVWLAAGLIAIGLGLIRAHWWLFIAGIFAGAYGSIWLRVAARSRLLSWREALVPWRARGGSQQ